MTKAKLSRRRMLRGVLAGAPVAVGLPRLQTMLDGNGLAYASGRKLPVRFGVWAMSNGVHLDRWVPRQTGAQFDLPDEPARWRRSVRSCRC